MKKTLYTTLFLVSSCFSFSLTANVVGPWLQVLINKTNYDVDYVINGTLGETFKGTALAGATEKINIGLSCVKDINLIPRVTVKPGPAPLSFDQPFKTAFPGCTDTTYTLTTTYRNQLEVNGRKGKGLFTGDGETFYLVGNIAQ